MSNSSWSYDVYHGSPDENAEAGDRYSEEDYFPSFRQAVVAAKEDMEDLNKCHAVVFLKYYPDGDWGSSHTYVKKDGKIKKVRN